jgi:hypothetical protein
MTGRNQPAGWRVVTGVRTPERSRAAFAIALLVTAVAGAAGCAAARPAGRPARPHPAAAGLPAPGGRCMHGGLDLRFGERVPAAWLAAIEFLSPADGAGVTASLVSCTSGPGGSGTGHLTPRLVTSADGGMTWRTDGPALPRWLQPGSGPAQLAFSGPGRGWLAAGGALAFTGDGGRHWQRLARAEQFQALASGGRYVAAVSRTRGGQLRVWRLAPGGATGLALTPVPGQPAIPAGEPAATALSVAVVARTGQIVLALPRGTGDRLIAQLPGRRWIALTEPCLALNGTDSPRAGFEALAAAPGGGLGVVCGHGAGMMHASHSFWLSRDGGRTWRRRATDRAFGPDRSGLPFSAPTAIASPERSHFYLATASQVQASADGGRHWRPVVPANVPGNATAHGPFSFAGPRRGWLLLPGLGLLRTTNGRQWAPLGARVI